MWLNEFKIALIRKDTQTLERLLPLLPSFSIVSQAKEAAFLLQQANELFLSLRDDTAISMMQIKKSSLLLRSTQAETPSRLDITL